MEEIWKKVIGFENYSVSNLGNVRNDVKNKPLKGRLTQKGYHSVILYNKGKYKSFRVHRLILSTFDNLDYTSHHLECNHIDENKLNNHLENLNWLSRKENMHWNNLHNRIQRKYTKSEYRIQRTKEALSVKIKRINIETLEVKYYNSISEASKEGFSSGNICSCCNGKRKQHKGYYWKYTANLKNQVLVIK